MSNAMMVLIDGVEETEAIATADVLRRGGVSLDMVSLMESKMIHGKHGIDFLADELFADIVNKDYDMIVIPGGTTDYIKHVAFMDWTLEQSRQGKKLAAICAAPVVLAKLGLLQNKKATSFPAEDVRKALAGADLREEIVVTDGNITTSRGAATALSFGIELLRILCGEETANDVADAIQLNWFLERK